MKNRPYILTLAGFDPSSGAGLSSDIKTFENLKCYGLGVCTAYTVQNDNEFKACHWVDFAVMKSQIELLFKRFEIEVVKIGIVENWFFLNQLIDLILEKNPKIKIVLDPILKASSNFDFHIQEDENSIKILDEILDKIYLLTPNYNGIQVLYSNITLEETISHISSKTNLYLKGGHREDVIGKDELYTKQGKHFTLNPKLKDLSEKHGSGCVLLSAIASYLVLEFPLLKACYKGKRYTEKVLGSNKSLLGYHK